MGMNERYVRVDEDTYEDLEFLRSLIRVRGINACIGYLLMCYGVYCSMLGLRNYELLVEHRRDRRMLERKARTDVSVNDK